MDVTEKEDYIDMNMGEACKRKYSTINFGMNSTGKKKRRSSVEKVGIRGISCHSNKGIKTELID